MEGNRGYYTDNGLGQPVHRCNICPYDTFEEDKAIYHAKTHSGVILPEADMTFDEWLAGEKAANRLNGVSITIGFLTWNTKAASELGAMSIVGEIERLRSLGMDADFCWVDNGSTDGTVESLKEIFNNVPGGIGTFPTNTGQCIGRNDFIDYARGRSKYLMMLDGDIELIPYSAYAMVRFLESKDRSYGCIGLLSNNCTQTIGDGVPGSCRCITGELVSTNPQIAWTQYGVYRTEMFDRGVRFDTGEPFRGPGWGGEDNDLYLQMQVAGYESYNTSHFRYYHRARSSSTRIMGIDVALKSWERRKEYMLKKWKGIHSAKWYMRVLDATHADLSSPNLVSGRRRSAATV